MNQEPNTPQNQNGQNPQNQQNNYYYTAPEYGRGFDPYAPPPTRTTGFSIASLILGIFGLLCCCFGPVGLICSLLAIVFAAISRRRLYLFDGMSTAGLILGILGAVAGLYMTFSYVVSFSDPEFWATYEEVYNEMMKEMENAAFRLLR